MFEGQSFFPALGQSREGAEGTVESAVRHYRGGSVGHASDNRVPEPWDVTFAGAVATFKRCIIPHGFVTTALSDITYTITGADGTICLAAKINTNNNPLTAEIIEGVDMASVTDAVPPTDEFCKRLLYVVSKATVGGVVSIAITEDHRRNSVSVAYV